MSFKVTYNIGKDYPFHRTYHGNDLLHSFKLGHVFRVAGQDH